MTPERWSQIEEIFQTALDLPLVERAKYVHDTCGDDVELRDEVEKLLAQFDESSDFIEQPIVADSGIGVFASLIDDGDDPVLGRQIGNYRIEREVGRGGMGTVYEAVRADGEFRMRAALKLVKRGMDTDFILRRFKNERQILATLEHPYITRLIDGGSTDDGRPYFVMEYIDGSPLYRYCDRNRSDIEERLELFGRICEAVEYAHQKMVIHRDLKPSNIFVTGDGTPRLLDFGIAKLLDPDLAHDTLQPTATLLRMMTVDYASPEQVRGEKVTFASDIYSLGVILYELLTGYRPYVIASRAPHDVAKAICDDEPCLPSIAAVGQREDLMPVRAESGTLTATEIALRRRETPESLAEKLRGNLDNIILKALRKDPAERYPSIGKFRDDLARHLSGGVVSINFRYPQLRREPRHDNIVDSKLVAVLPLSLLSPAGTENTDESYLTLGLADAMITRLTSVNKLTVRPTSSITRYNEHLINPFRAGVELGVDFVLDGRIRRFGERIRISLQLLDVAAGSAIWAGQFDERLNDVLELEDAIAEQVAAALIPQLTGEDRQRLAKRGTSEPLAYEAYLRGRFYWGQFTSQSLPKAIEAYEKAIEIDPNYALAHVGIADFYLWASIYGLISSREGYELAERAARRALQIDPELGEAYASLGLITLNNFEYEKAERLLQRSIDLVPHYSLVHEWYSAMLIGTGRTEQGLKEIRLAEELDPMSLRTKTLVAWTTYQAGRFDDALAKAEEIISFDENYPQGHIQRSYVLCELGRADEAVESAVLANRLMPDTALAQYALCFALAAAGRTDEVVALADEMEERSAREFVKPMVLGLANVAAQRFDKAFEYFEAAVDEHDPWLVWLGTDPKYRPLHDDPRFLSLLERSRKRFENGRVVSTTGGYSPEYTSAWTSDGKTMTASELPTLEFRPSFARRHAWKIGFAAIAAFLLIVGFWTGVITVSTRAPILPGSDQQAKRSIAVLPFENATGDAANDYISDGMSESLISRISEFSDLRVISRGAAFSYRTRQLDPQTIGRELSVENVLIGTLTRSGDQLSLKTELVNVADGKREFSIIVEDSADRMLTFRDDLVAKVMGKLNLNATPRSPVAQKAYTQNNAAFELYLKGEFNRQKGTPAGTREGIEDFENAIKIDPNYALAYQGLALALRSAPAYGYLSPQEAYTRARDAAERALALDPNLSSANVSLASIKATYDWDFPAAEAAYKKAIQLGPNNAEAHYSYGNFLVAMGRTDEAMNEFRIAQQLDPVSLNIATNIGWAMYIAGRYDEAAAAVRQVIQRDPTFARGYMNLGEILQEQGKYDDAIAQFLKAKELSDDPLTEMALGHVYAVSGRRAEALRIAASLEERVRSKQVSPFLPAVVYAGLNDKDKAFYWLERAYQERSNWLTLIKVGRRLKPLNGDPRFDDLLKRVGFDS